MRTQQFPFTIMRILLRYWN